MQCNIDRFPTDKIKASLRIKPSLD